MPRLTIELVPRTCWYSNVRSNVTKKEWDTIRLGVYAAANSVCEICSGTGKKWPVECHEIWSYDDKRKIQSLSKMIALCPNCHEVKHIGRAQAVGNYDRAIKHLATVNNWTSPRADQYACDQFGISSKTISFSKGD